MAETLLYAYQEPLQRRLERREVVSWHGLDRQRGACLLRDARGDCRAATGD
jgi:hypothetical protein